MKLIQSKKAEINYLSKIVDIRQFRSHSNPEVTRLKCCTVDGFNIITGIDSEPGLYVYFPALSKINDDFLRYANLYKDKTLNSDPEQSGMFEKSGRVKAIKLKGEISEGFIIPVVVLQNYALSVTNIPLKDIEAGTEFDAIEHFGKSFWISKKYVPKQTQGSGIKAHTRNLKKGYDKLINTQFRFHYDTILIKKEPEVLTPETYIHLSYKVHGTSGISAYILCKQKLSWKQKIAKFLTKEPFNKYDYIYSSRKVIKNQYYNPKVNSGFYDVDIWGMADEVLRPYLSKGLTLYYEIIGYLPNGKYIQEQYDYGCIQPKVGEKFEYNKHFKIKVYRITYTNVDGNVFEFSPIQVYQWCKKTGLDAVETCYIGTCKDLYPDIPNDENWRENFLTRLGNDKKFYMEQNSPHCNNKVPHEGLVIKLLNKPTIAFKLKCFAFLNKEQALLDKGEINIEDLN